MTLITRLETLPKIDTPCGLTIGTFDGVHLGHQALLLHLKMELPSQIPLVVFTFANHPSSLFSPHSPTPLIYPKEKKAELLFFHGANSVIMPDFTPSFAKTSYEEFLTLLKDKLCFSHLILGEGSTFGKDREGNESRVRELAKKLDFHAEYLPKTLFGQEPISSRRIRIAIKSGYLEEASACLGRPYSLCGSIILKKEHPHFILEKEICSPPEGTYSVHLKTSTSIQSIHAHITQHGIILEPTGRNEIPSADAAELLFSL